MSSGSVKLKLEGKPLITVGLPVDVDMELPPSASSLTPSLGEMRRGEIQPVLRVPGIAVTFSFCSGLSLHPTPSRGPAAY